MKRYIAILFVLLPCLLIAQTIGFVALDSLASGDTLRVEQFGDTTINYLFLRENLSDQLSSHLSEDEVLLELVAQQGRSLCAKDTAWKEYPHPLCIPLMYVPTPFPRLLDTTNVDPYSIVAIRRNARRYITTQHADLYVACSDMARLKDVELGHVKVRKAIVKDAMEDMLERERAVRYKDSHWRRELNLALQITQNYATNNWYQGQSNAFAMLASAKGYINYNHNNLSWENNAEWRMGISTVSGDSLRMINTTDDIFRINSKFGYQVHKSWYVSASTELRTNLLNNWQKNKDQLSATFLTPIRFTVGVGVDYKPIEGLSINLAPATYKIVYAFKSDSEQLDVTDFGIEAGESMLTELGSLLRVDWKWQPVREIIVDTKFYFFTNYQRIETELEINMDFIINRYFSAKLLLYPRYDGLIKSDDGLRPYLQFKELVSVGFSHTFR